LILSLVPPWVITAPPQEWPTRTTSPLWASTTRRTAATSSASDDSGFCTDTTFKPFACSSGVTWFQLDPSANAPCTSTTVVGAAGAARAWPGKTALADRAAEINSADLVAFFMLFAL